MKFQESDDPKDLLLKKTAKHKQELEEEVKSLSEGTEKLITNAVVIGGTLLVTYFLVRQFTKSKTKKRAKKVKIVKDADANVDADASVSDSSPGIVSQIGSALAAQATVFLLDLAKDKLSAYLQARGEKETEPSNERS
jgi:hypothetical protein